MTIEVPSHTDILALWSEG